MKALALINGDLVAGQSGHVTISGAAKIKQDLTNALGEHWGTDRFHSDRWGTIAMDFIGLPTSSDTVFQVRSEIGRVLQQYISIQEAEVYADMVAGRRSRFATADVVREVSSIQVNVQPLKVLISINLITQAGQDLTVNRSISQ